MRKLTEKQVYSIIANVALILCGLIVVVPILIVFMSSFSEESAAIKYGYTIWPRQFSLDAYRYVASKFDVIGRAYLITVVVTIVGTTLSLLITACLGYGLSQKNLPGRKFFMFMVFFTMLFNGGLIPTYYFYTNVFHVKNTYFAYIVPGLLCNAFNVILLRNYFSNSVSAALRESAKIDGCGEFKIFWTIIVPLSTPILATVGLLNAIAYWNDWQNGLYYMDDANRASIQQVLRNMTNNISYLSNTSSLPSASRQIPGVTVRMAIAVLSMVPLMAAFPFFEKYFVKGISIGAVKE
ncbi:MAG: carbohydrate ABC transporter permease [Lachnospiraceae bacterium]|jgi:putative aldouronate transport system permease protein|nr:carbohydrate ABC transporter permease [Lachnospiraceae bacterium]